MWAGALLRSKERILCLERTWRVSDLPMASIYLVYTQNGKDKIKQVFYFVMVLNLIMQEKTKGMKLQYVQ